MLKTKRLFEKANDKISPYIRVHLRLFFFLVIPYGIITTTLYRALSVVNSL